MHREYDEGYGAYQRGLDSWQNPYPEDTDEHHQWHIGWRDAYWSDRDWEDSQWDEGTPEGDD